MQFKAKGLLVALAAVFAMSAVVASAASAVKPEFKPVPAKKKFTISGGASYWRYYAGETIACAKTSATGELDGAATVGNVTVVYSGCKSSGAHMANCPVNSTGAKAEEIVTKPLDGELGTVATSQAASGVGLRFKPENKSEKWLTFEKNGCTVELTLSGQLAAEVSVIGKKQATNKLVFLPGATGEKIKAITLDTGLVENPELNAFGYETSIEAEDELKFEEPLEVT